VLEMRERLTQRPGTTAGATGVVDRGRAEEATLAPRRAPGWHAIGAGRQPERDAWLAEVEADDGAAVGRPPAPRNPAQHTSRGQSKRRQPGHAGDVRCRSAGREEHERALRQTHAHRL
jgi:hypothetical protein